VAVSGWYPDPGGSPDRYRYWDGSHWSAETTDNPAAPPPSTPGSSTSRAGRRTGWIVGLVAMLIVIVVVGVLAIRSLSGGGTAVSDPNPPESTTSGWDDSSPLPTASPSPTPSKSPSTDSNPHGQVACAAGDPYAAAAHPADGRIHGGRLSIGQPGPPWIRDDDYARDMTWAYDVAGASEHVEPMWLAMVSVGSVHADDGFRSPRQAADGMLQCIASSVYYRYFTGRKDIFSKPFQLDGRSGWALRAEVRVDDPNVRAAGDVVEVIVLDTGTPGQLSFFAGFVPIGDQARLRLLNDTIAGIRVE
jgi:hypothetical protein